MATSPHHEASSHEERAKCSIAALSRAISEAYPEKIKLDGVVLLPGIVPLSIEAAATQLARLPKPICCYAFVAAGCVAVGWWNPSELPEHLEWLQRVPEHGATRVPDALRKSGEQAKVLIRGLPDDVIVTLQEYEMWRNEYFLEFVSMRLRLETADAEHLGIGAIVTVSLSEGGTIEGVVNRRL